MPITDDWAEMTVTVVDDEPVVRDVLVRAARSWSYECQAAATAEQAMELLEQRPTSIVVTDLRMPGQGGVWLVREVRRRWPHAAVIVLTAGQDREAARQCLEAGADHFFVKPVKLNEFHHVLERTRLAHQQRRVEERYRRKLERAVRKQTLLVRRTYLSAIDSLVRTMEERDAYTAGHSRRVRDYSLRLGQSLGLDDRQMRELSLAAKLHDIGKVGIPDAILNKPGPLTEAESRTVREHPIIGERILHKIVRRREVLAAIRGHHERVDGAGYPDRLKGTKIPLLARIITVTDCFDALTSARAYRAPLTMPQALEILLASAGTHFQPEFVHTFVELARTLPLARPPVPSPPVGDVLRGAPLSVPHETA
jgi:response regulator RpfG family c-di-GMP phosphodiesterase